MTVEQRIKKEILLQTIQKTDFDYPLPITEDNINIVWDLAYDYKQDAQEEFRSSGIETGLDCKWSRHYESESVAKQMSDGTWVGFTYWYGGGKHGEPEGVDWMDEAYEVEMTEVMMPVKTFKKK